jgi:hypothetical protein
LRQRGEPAGLAAVLDDLDRRARPTRPWRTRCASAFRWDTVDARTRDWMPQGITTSADADPSGRVHGRAVVAVSWYLRDAAGPDRGARVTFVDVTRLSAPRYRHVLLVEPAWQPRGARPATRPVPVHAGGIVWYGDVLFVASTYTGLRVFHLADLVRVDPAAHGGHRYLLPQRWAYTPAGDPGARMRYSFVSLDRTTTPHGLLAGEYGRGDAPTQIARFALDASTGRLRTDGGTATPVEAFGLDVRSMQGVVCVDRTYVVTASRGRRLRGDLWVGDPCSGFRRRHGALPAGPEDLSVWPERGRLWSLTEYPGRRTVFALRTGDWLTDQRP